LLQIVLSAHYGRNSTLLRSERAPLLRAARARRKRRPVSL